MALNPMPRIVVSVAPGMKGAKGDTGDLPADAMLQTDYDADGDKRVDITAGGTGANNIVDARTNLGLGDASVEDVVPVAKGGTGATTDSDARTNLGLGALAVLDNITADGISDDSGDQAAILEKIGGASDSDLTTLSGRVTDLEDSAPGVDQTWQDVTSSRSAGTSYQNTTGRPIEVLVQFSPGESASDAFKVSTDNVNFVVLTVNSTKAGLPVSVKIPNDHYYRMSSPFTKWSELR